VGEIAKEVAKGLDKSTREKAWGVEKYGSIMRKLELLW